MKTSNPTIGRFAMSAVIGCLGLSYGYAANPPATPPTPIVILLPPKQPIEIGHRPKAPSMQQVSCTYSEGNLYFEFSIPEGACHLILSDPATGEIVGASFDSAVTEPVYVGYHSTATLTVTTANGNTYTGTW